MPGYEKITVRDFKKKLEGAQYANLTGARRGIGRMTTWSDKEKDRARAIAEKYFGEEPSTDPAKKKTGKLPTRKVTKKKKKATRSAKASSQSATSSKVKAKKPTGKKAKGGGSSPPTRQPTVHEQIDLANEKTNAMRNVLNEVERTSHLGVPESEVAQAAKKAQAGLSAIIDEICALSHTLVNEPTDEEREAAADFATAAKASCPGGNGVPVAPKSSPARTPQPVAPPQPTTKDG